MEENKPRVREALAERFATQAGGVDEQHAIATPAQGRRVR